MSRYVGSTRAGRLRLSTRHSKILPCLSKSVSLGRRRRISKRFKYSPHRLMPRQPPSLALEYKYRDKFYNSHAPESFVTFSIFYLVVSDGMERRSNVLETRYVCYSWFFLFSLTFHSLSRTFPAVHFPRLPHPPLLRSIQWHEQQRQPRQQSISCAISFGAWKSDISTARCCCSQGCSRRWGQSRSPRRRRRRR